MSPTDLQLILASGSPRRKDLLNEAGYTFEVIPPDVEELDDPDMEIRKLTAINAKLKAEAVAPKHPDKIVVAADTLVLFKNKALGKPDDMQHAAKMLAAMNGQSHQVYTAVCLIQQSQQKTVEFDVYTDVTFKQMTQAEMTHYHSLIEPLDKAGAYAAQDHGELIIEKSVGSSTNVIGLPMEELANALEQHFC